MANPVPELQQPINKSIIELFSVELIPDLHYPSTSFSNEYNQNSSSDIVLNSATHGLSVGNIISIDFTSGNAISGVYTVTATTSTSFTVKSTVSTTTSGLYSISRNTDTANASVYLFHSGNNMKDNFDIIWQGNKYTRMPCKADGFKYTGKGKLPRPTITFSNLLGTITTAILLANVTTPFIDLQRAKVTRRRTLARFLDEENFPSNINPYKVGSVDPTAEFPREVYFIDRKVIENRDVVQFEMVSSFDLSGVGAPKKLVTRNDFAGIGTFVNF
tara:strand:- start:1485 stop:2306 length:822 start_codon:yes stop_codon:yes gene_type:complete